MEPEKVRETKIPIRRDVDKVDRQHSVGCGTNSIASNYNLLPPTSKMLQSKIDATDRRHIEALNEDKSHTTKETLDDIKRIHQKEKTKKNQKIFEQYQTGMDSDRWVSKILLGLELVHGIQRYLWEDLW